VRGLRGLSPRPPRIRTETNNDMKLTFRPSTPDDQPAITALLIQTLGFRNGHPTLSPEQLAWRYWAPRRDLSVPRSYVLERGAQVLAHAGAFPGELRYGENSFTSAHLVDWAARPDAIGAGSALLKHIGGSFDSLFTVGGSPATQAILPNLGFRLSGAATGLARALQPRRRMSLGLAANLRGAARVGRALVWRALSPPFAPPGWTVRRIEPGELPSGGLVAGPTAGAHLTLARGAEQLRHLMACPTVRSTLYRVERTGTNVIGYFLLSVLHAQARLGAFGLRSDSESDWRALMELASVSAARDTQAVELVTLTADPRLCAWLGECGFHARMQAPTFMLARNDSLPRAPLAPQMVDFDLYCRWAEPDSYWA
jgi:hypothetical protein